MEEIHVKYIKRCFDLAKRAQFQTGSNPAVGAILVNNDTIIGEGWYQQFGAEHAEVMAINSVKKELKALISSSTLYVSLEPCCIHGKTPPCTDAIISHGIKKVVISSLDPNQKMNGKSVQLLKDNGVEVIDGVLNQQGKDIIRPFAANLRNRPYVIIKFAQSSDGYFGKRNQQVWISNSLSQIKVHQWRSEVDGILIGKGTAAVDDPELTVRLVPGDNPLRIIIDKDQTLSKELKIWRDEHPSLFISSIESSQSFADQKEVLIIKKDDHFLSNLLSKLYEKGVYTLLVEGGKETIKTFITNNLWDEARVITSSNKMVSGIRAPLIKGREFRKEKINNDRISYVYPE